MTKQLAALVVAAGLTALSLVAAVNTEARSVSIQKSDVALYCEQPATRAEVLGCGETTCHTNADCPSTCGPCIAWSGTCALFAPRAF